MSKNVHKVAKAEEIRNVAGYSLQKAYPGYRWAVSAEIFEDKNGEFCHLVIYNTNISNKEGYVYVLDGYKNDPMEITRLAMLAGGQILEMANLPRKGIDETFLLAKKDVNGKIIVNK